MARRTFRFIIFIAIALGVVLFITKESYSRSLLLIVSTLLFLMLSLGIHGLIAHSLRPPATKAGLITFPLFMWVLWLILFLLFVFFVIPLYYPDFLIDV